MGTNYYVIRDVCVHCGRGDEPKHIGKNSAGWCFALHIYPDEGIRDLKDWEPLLMDPKARIEDEYGEALTSEEMLVVIKERSWVPKKEKPAGYSSWEEFYRSNYAEPGPDNLVRHKIGPYCAGHGAGPWDLISSEFS